MRATMTRQVFAEIAIVCLLMAIGCTGTHAPHRLSHSAKPSNVVSMDSIWKFRSLHSAGQTFDPIEAW
jgi:hypothetical protein